MAYAWEEYLFFDSSGRIEILDTDLAKMIVDALNNNNKKITIYYETPGGPGQKENLLCTCRAS
jgi:hypothetical protein